MLNDIYPLIPFTNHISQSISQCISPEFLHIKTATSFLKSLKNCCYFNDATQFIYEWDSSDFRLFIASERFRNTLEFRQKGQQFSITYIHFR